MILSPTSLSMAVSLIDVAAGALFSGEPRSQTRHFRLQKGRFSRPSFNGLHSKFFWRIPETINSISQKNFAVQREGEEGSLSNMSEDTDDMFDDLFNKYGKTVYKRKDMKRPTDEVDDDAESLSFAVEMARVASDVKAAEIKVLFVKPLVYWTRFFIIVTAFSRPQIDAIGSRIRDLAEKKYEKVPSGDTKPKSWTLLDFGDVVVHIFLPEQRAYYNLEEFYANATAIELPFESQPPFRT